MLLARQRLALALQIFPEMDYTGFMGIETETRASASGSGNLISKSRKHVRYDCDLQVSYEGLPGQLRKATTANISPAGLFVKTQELPKKPMLMLEVSISHARTVFLWSEVRHCTESSPGAQIGFGVSIPAPPSVWREYCERLSQN